MHGDLITRSDYSVRLPCERAVNSVAVNGVFASLRRGTQYAEFIWA